jgi:hypothetical protein
MLLAWLCAASSAQAGELSPEQREELDKHLRQASKLSKASKHEQALKEYKAAQAITDHPKIALAILRTLGELGRCEEADQGYVTLSTREDVDPSLRQTMQNERQALLKRCAAWPGTLVVRCPVDKTQLTIDGEPLDCDQPKELAPGEHELRANAPDHYPVTAKLTIEPRAKLESTANLSRQAPKVVTSPKTELRPINWTSISQWSLVGLGGLAIVAGLGLDTAGFVRRGDMRDLSEQEGWTASERDDAESYAEVNPQLQLATIICYIAGPVLLASGITWMLLEDDDPKLEASVSPSGDAASMQLHLRW